MGKKIHLLLIVLLLVINIKAQNQEFTPYNQGTQFVSIEVDGVTNRVWAASRFAHGDAIVKLETDQDPAPTVFTTFEGITPTGTPLKNYFIRDIAIDGLGNVWVGHYGYGNNNVVGGVEKIKSNLSLEHYFADDAVGVSFGGLLTRKVRSIITDKNNKVWAAQYHHRLIGIGGDPSTIWPGTLAFKGKNSWNFKVLGNRYRCSTQPTELPYPNNTFEEVIVPTDAERNFQALSSDDTEVWASHWAYQSGPQDSQCSEPHTNINDRILRYNVTTGAYIGKFIDTQMSFPTGSTITNICRNNGLGTWVTTYTANSGFSVYKNDSWIHISSADFPNILESGTAFNANAMWKDKNGRVYMGTNNGLIVYNGIGDVDAEGSYKKYIKHSFNGIGDIIYDGTMISENIFGGCTDPNDSRINWLATDNGIMKLVTTEALELYNVPIYHDCMTVLENTFRYDSDCSKLNFVAELDNDQFALERRAPSIAADGTPSTVFRIDTDTPQEYYDNNQTLMVGPATSLNDIEDANYIKRYGEFKIRQLTNYGFTGTDEEIYNQLEYVDFVYVHPEYIGEYETDKNYELLDFRVVDNNMISTYASPIKIAVPPVLLGHGVWSNIESLNKIEDYFKSHGFDKFLLAKAWREDASAAENSFKTDRFIIPDYIKKLKSKAAANRFSTGKVNVIVHSRGGLYTRAYIEGIEPNLSTNYRHDVNSLITLNTPHSGSQAANLVMDRRIVRLSRFSEALHNIPGPISSLASLVFDMDDMRLGELVSLSGLPPEKDRAYNYGAKNLLVQIDVLSGVDERHSDVDFLDKLNNPTNLQKLNGVPIHVIATTFRACEVSSAFCNNILETIGDVLNSADGAKRLPKSYFKAVWVYNALETLLNNVPATIDGVTGYLYRTSLLDSEPNDIIVPWKSMKAGLTGDKFVSTFPNANLAHIDISNTIIDAQNASGVTAYEGVHAKLRSLIRENVNDTSSESSFTKSGLNPLAIPYLFLSNWHGDTGDINKSPNEITSKIFINKDPLVFDNVNEGDALNFNIYTEDLDKLMVTYENPVKSDSLIYEIRNQINFENNMNYTVPEGYYGKITVTANGYKNGLIKSMDTIHFNVGLPSNIILQGIHFEDSNPAIYSQNEYSYNLIGSFSDGIERRINNYIGVVYSIEDNTIISQIDNNIIKGELVGTSILMASINGLEDSILVKVKENPSLQQTILVNFYGTPNTGNTNINVFWETLQEYENATFVLETSYGTPDNFTEINQQAGNGTLNTPVQFNFEDTTFGANTLIYYRIKLIDTSGNFTYSSIIEVNLSTAILDDNNLSESKLELHPNPTETNEVILKLDSKFTDKNAKLTLYSLQGKRLSVQTLNVIEGANSFKLKIGEGLTNGIYLVRVTTTNYIKTVKLIVEK